MNAIEFAESLKEDIIQSLDEDFFSIKLSQISELAEAIEHILIEKVKNILKKYSKELFGILCEEDKCFLVSENKDVLFTINVAESLKDPGLLHIVIAPNILGEKIKLSEYTILIKGFGRIKMIILSYPDVIDIKLDIIHLILREIYESVYNWFKIKISCLVSSERVALTEELYNFTKKIITSEKLRKHLWYATVTKGYGFRLIEQDVALDLFDQISPNAEYFWQSTNRLVAEMLSTRLPKEKILMQKAIESNKILDVSIKDAPYSKEGDIYAAAMFAFYGGDSFTIHPIVTDKDTSVLALYPTDKRNELEPIINLHKKKLVEISQRSTKLINKAIDLFDKGRRSFTVGKLGEFCGGFLSGFIGT